MKHSQIIDGAENCAYSICRIRGTLFIGLLNKKRYYPTKRESDLDKRIRRQ